MNLISNTGATAMGGRGRQRDGELPATVACERQTLSSSLQLCLMPEVFSVAYRMEQVSASVGGGILTVEEGAPRMAWGRQGHTLGTGWN